MIQEIKKDIFDPFFNVKIVTLNKVGVAGKGLALEFRKRYPEWYNQYVETCKLPRYSHIFNGWLESSDEARCWIFNWYTKNHWKENSNLELIQTGAKKLSEDIIDYQIEWANIGIPKVGCQNGKLDWKDVKPILDKELEEISKFNNIYYLL